LAFEDCWRKMSGALGGRSVINTCSPAGRATGRPFKVVRVDDGFIEVESINGKSTQRISKAKFKEIYDIWIPYCSGTLKRPSFDPKNRVTTYVISILHFVESKCGGHLP
jgi:hypothetical protein